MKFTSTIAVASLLSAVLVAAVPVPTDLNMDLEVRDILDELDARELDFDLDLEARDFDEYDARELDFDEFDARDLEDYLFERSPTLGGALRKAAGDTADMAVKKVAKAVNNGNRTPLPPPVARPAYKAPAPQPRPAVPSVKMPGPVPAAAKPQVNWGGAYKTSALKAKYNARR